MPPINEAEAVETVPHEIYIAPKKPFVCDKGVGQVLFENMKKWSDNVAQIDAVTGEKETYAQLLSRSIRTAQNMHHKGVKPGDVVSLLSYNNMDFSCILLASFFNGFLNAPMDPTSPLIDLTHCLKLTTPKILFCEAELETLAEEAVKTTGFTIEIVIFGKTDRNTPFSDFLVEREPEHSFEIHPVTDVKSTSCLHFSSGTSGLPKGVCITHYGLLFPSHALASMSFLNKTTMTVTSPFWISNMNGMITSILCGNARVMMKMFDEKLIMKYVNDYQIYMIMITPANGAILIKHPEYFEGYDLSCLKIIGTGGSVTSPQQYLEYKRLFPKALAIGGYGMTEAGAIVLSPTIQTAEEYQNSQKVCVGTPIPGFRYMVVDTETEEAIGPNIEGELRLKHEGIMNAYYRNPEAYKNAFDSKGYLKTGDILYYDENNKFYYVTRIKDIFKYKGSHISPSIIESELIKHPNIKQAVVIGVPGKQFGELATAAIILNDPGTQKEQEFIDFIADRLPERYQLHGGVYVVDKIPITSNGKILRRKLRETILELKNAV